MPDLGPKDTPQPSPVSTPRGTPVPSPKHSPSRPLRTPTPTESPETPSHPLTPKHPIPCWKSISSQDSVDSDSDSTMMITTKELVDTLTMTLKNINQNPTIPLPVFKGKKGEDLEDHIFTVEDYFEIHEIKREGDKSKRFKDTLFETARKWVPTLNYTEVNKFDCNPKDENDKKASMKYLFLARFAKEGRTLEAAYNASGTLTFDPNKDNIEQFVSKVEDLAKKLGYNEDAQVMAVKVYCPQMCMASV